MSSASKPVAIIPARGGSKRLPRKNVADFGGKPMLAHPIAAARESGIFRRIIVSTEDREIADIAVRYGAEVLHRPSRLADDTSGVTDVCLHSVQELRNGGDEFDEFCCIYATAALVIPDDLIVSYALLRTAPEPDMVMGVCGYPIHPFKALTKHGHFLRPMWPEENAKKSQEFPEAVASNGTIYWGRTESFLRQQTFYPERLVAYHMPHDRAVDLDTEEDLDRARMLLSMRQHRGR